MKPQTVETMPGKPRVSFPDTGVLTVIPLEGLRIHSYQAPETAVFVSSHILETPNRLIVIDTQFLRPHAEQFRRYIDSLNKLIDRVIITHSHPDHWFGSEFFRDVPRFALQGVADEIAAGGEAMIQSYAPAFGNAITETVVAPQGVVRPGSETIDGIRLSYEEADGAEAGVNLVIELPAHRVLIAQDIVYNRVHPFLRQKDVDPWLSIIRRYREGAYDLVLAGHGLPTNMQALAEMERYLTGARSALAASSDIAMLKERLVGGNPGYQGELMLDISARYLYGAEG
ncbi:MAG: MBL fold metallo-hydrolase [Methanomicrobiaceae archaeon]|uniref:Putative metallo beta lactamase superfamily protein n=1 Tax=hydrocarbon metagenome TaxID=938273 RepID=A0A0W8FEU3_9ZZZZ|nr:MBL fold metallo-hydrolase [Methanomicrobiaceae archaeon]